MKTFSLSSAASSASLTVLFASLLFLGCCIRNGGAKTMSTVTNTYMINTSGYRVIQLRCDVSNSSAANGTSPPMCTIETYGQSCDAAYTSGSLDDPPYFLPTSGDPIDGDDYAQLTECSYMDDVPDDWGFKTNGANGTAAKFAGLVTVTCDSACTCDTGSYNMSQSADGSSISYSSTFIPDGGSCPVQRTVTYQYNTSNFKAVQLRCDSSNSTEVTWRPMCTIEKYGQSCTGAYTSKSLDSPPYFRPTNGDDFAHLVDCGYKEYGGSDNGSTVVAPYEGAVTITCDTACTCETGSYPTMMDANGNLDWSETRFIPDGGSCPVISMQPGEQVGPASPPMPLKYFSGTNVGPGEHMQVWCDGGDGDEALYGGCESEGFSSWSSLESIEWFFGYHNCTDGGSCLVTCPSICTCTVVVTDYDIVVSTAAEAQAGYPCEETDGTTASAVSRHSMNALLRTLVGLFLAGSASFLS